MTITELVVKGVFIGLGLFSIARFIWERAYLKGFQDAAEYFITEMHKAVNKKKQ